MTFGVRRKIERYYENMQRDEVEEKLRGKPLVEEDIVGFCEKRLGFKPTSYQEKLFRDQNQFIVGIWSRQSGKSQALAVLALYQALAKPKARIVVLAPSLRQSRKIVQRVGSFLSQLPEYIVNGKILQTRLKFVNGSSIEALPNNAPTARGETLDMLICLPGSARILTLGGASVRIDKLSPGETVLSYNTFTHLLESKRILRVFKNNLADRSMVRVRHENGSIDCTFEHKIYTTNRGYVPAGLLTLSDQLVTTQKRGLETTILDPVQISPKATDTRRTPRRLLSHEGQRTPKKRVLGMPAFLQASRVRSIKYSMLKEFVRNPPKLQKNLGFGKWSVRFPTLVHPTLTELYHLTYPGGKKTVNWDWLDRINSPLALAIWFMDDGSISRSTAEISTHSFSLSGCQILKIWLRTTWGLEARTQLDKRVNRYFLRFPVSDTEKLFELIRPHVIPSMSYKLVVPQKRFTRHPRIPQPPRVEDCVVCHQSFVTKHPWKKTCSKKCHVEWRKRLLHTYRLLYNPRRRFLRTLKRMQRTLSQVPCICCGRAFTPRSGHHKVCSYSCRRILDRRRYPHSDLKPMFSSTT